MANLKVSICEVSTSRKRGVIPILEAETPAVSIDTTKRNIENKRTDTMADIQHPLLLETGQIDR